MKKSILNILQTKKQRPLVCATAYDYPTAKILSDLEFDIILVGDSAGMEVQGYESTIYVTLDDIIYHSKAVSRANQNCLVVADMPYLTAEGSVNKSIKNAGKLIQNGHVDAVKIEGGSYQVERISKLIQAGIPVMGHIGLTPQQILNYGRYQVQGKTDREFNKIYQSAIDLEKAGAFSIVLECIPTTLAQKISKSIKIPTIGIGAGKECDGQILVCNDISGLNQKLKPRFVKQYANLNETLTQCFKNYQTEVLNKSFPDDSQSYHL